MKIKKIITVGACGLIALASIISSITVHAQELKKVEIPVTVSGGQGTVEIKGNDDDSELALEGNQLIEVSDEGAFFVGYTTEPCEYEYTVKQTAVANGYTFDKTEYTVHVFVAQEKDGLVPTVAVWKKGTETKCESVSFDNKAPTVSKKGKKSTDTSDENKILSWLVLALGAMSIVAGVIVYRKSCEDKGHGNDK